MLSASMRLAWPSVSQLDGAFVANALDVGTTAPGLFLAMPDARAGALGPVSLVAHTGGPGFTLADDDGASITSVSAGQSWLVALTGNATAGGVWRALRLGSLTNSASAGQLADGLTIQANASNQLQLIEPENVLGSSATLGTAARGALNVLPDGEAAALWVLDASATLTVGWWTEIANQTSGNAITLVGTSGETINGLITFIVNPGTSARIVCNGAGTFVTSLASLLPADALIYGGATAAATPKAQIALGLSGQVLTSAGASLPSFQAAAAYVQPAQTNLVINGGCRVGARAQAAVSVAVTTTRKYGQVDMIQICCPGSAAPSAGSLVQVSGNAYGSTGYSARLSGLTTTKNDATVTFTYRVESSDAVIAAPTSPGNTVTVQAVVLQDTGLTQNYQIALSYPTSGTDNYAGGTTSFGISANLQVVSGVATTISWTTSALSTSGGVGAAQGLQIDITCNCGAVTNRNFDLTDLGLFLSSTPVAPFPETFYEHELRRCERYLVRYFWETTSVPTYLGYNGNNTFQLNFFFQFRTMVRAAPTDAGTNGSTGLLAAAGAYDLATATINSLGSTGPGVLLSNTAAAKMIFQTGNPPNLTANGVGFFGSGTGPTALYDLLSAEL